MSHQQFYPNGTEVIITDIFCSYTGCKGHIRNFSTIDGTYYIELVNGRLSWFEEFDFTPVVSDWTKKNIDWDMGQPDTLGWAIANKRCKHSWKGTVLINTTVYDCTKCGIKKEDYDKENEWDDGVPF